MVRNVCIFLAVIIVLGCGQVQSDAQELPEFKLVRGLRDQGMPDLALEYLEKISKQRKGSASKLLALELARTRLALARQTPEPDRRRALTAQARQGFRKFLETASKQDSLYYEASLELARVARLLGENQVSRARKSEQKSTRVSEMRSARPYFEAAAASFGEAANALAKRNDDQVTQLRLQARLEQGISLFELGETFLDQNEVRERGKTIDAAKALFAKVIKQAQQAGGAALPILWEARAWIAECDYANDRKKEASDQFLFIMQQNIRSKPATRAGVRVALFFLIQHALFDQNDLAKANQRAEQWIRLFPEYVNSPEGLSTRYYLALTLQGLVEAKLQRDKQSGSLRAPPTGTVREQLERAKEIYELLAAGDHEYSQRAEQKRLGLVLDLATGRSEDADQLRSFEECYVQAQVQQAKLARLIEATKKNPTDNPQQRIDEATVQTFKKVVNYIQRGLGLVDAGDDPSQVDEARLLLIYAYLNTKNYPRAAIMGEHLARSTRPTSKTLNAALNALQAYNLALQAARRQNQPDLAADMRRLKNLAKFILTTWPEEPDADNARHQLGFYQLQQQDLVAACKTFQSIQDSYVGINQVRLLHGAAAYQLQKSDVDPQQKQQLLTQAIAGLSKLPAALPDSPGEVANAYCRARLQLGQLYLIQKDYRKVQTLGDKVVEQIANFAYLDKDQQQRLSDSAQALQLTGLAGAALELMKTDDLDQAQALLEPVVESIQNELTRGDRQGVGLEFQNLRRAQRNILALILRIVVRQGLIAKAEQLVVALQNSGEDQESINVLRQVVNDIRVQIEALRDQGETEPAEAMAASFSKVLDQIADQVGLSEQMLIFLSQGYASIDQHARAARLLEDFLNANQSDQTKERFIKTVEYLLAKTYREAGEYTKARALLDKIIGTKADKGWGYTSLEIRKEEIYLLEAQKRWRTALGKWTTFARLWRDRIKPDDPNDQARDIYFDFYVETQRCLAAANSTLSDQVKDRQFDKIADALIRLETKNANLRPPVQEAIRNVLSDYPLLKQKYQQMGGKFIDP